MKKLIRYIFSRLHLKKIILFESYPDFSDSSLCVYNELKKRHGNKYRYVWQLSSRDKELATQIKREGVRYYYDNPKSFFEHLRISYYRHNADIIIFSNNFVRKYFSFQKSLYVTHGIVIKDLSNKYFLPDYLEDSYVLCISEKLFGPMTYAFHCNQNRMLPLGLPRNDMLLNTEIDLHTVFPERSFKKAVYWLPTFRQHIVGLSVSSIAIPVIHDVEVCRWINEIANKNDVLIIIKPHFAQDLSLLEKIELSNILFIDEAFLRDNNIKNYELLGSCDALITDYSSVFYDYLLCDRPIGLCWEDFEEYQKNEGFVDGAIDNMKKASEILITKDDLACFIENLSLEKDIKKEERHSVISCVHKYSDGYSTQRVVDFIEKELLNS